MAPAVLVAFADPSYRTSLLEQLRGRVDALTVVSSIAEAVAALRSQEFDIILSDLGAELLAASKQIDPECEVILAAERLDTAIASLRTGAFDCMNLPVDIGEVCASIARAAERRELRAERFLYQASRKILDAGEPHRLPEMIVEVAMTVMHADDVSLMLPSDDEHLYVAYSNGLAVDIANMTHIAIGERVAGRVAETCEPAFLPNGLSDDPRFADVPSHGRVRSSIVYPLATRGHLLGVLSISRTTNGRPFRRRDFDLATVLASQILLALENNRLVQQLIVAERLASIGQLAAGVAHEINNPVAYVLASQHHIREHLPVFGELAAQIEAGAPIEAIRATFERAGGSPLVAQLIDATDDIREGAMRVREIVRDVWSLARSDSQTPNVFDLNEAVRSAVRIAAAQIKRHADVQMSLGAGVTTRANLGRISQVFVNLLVNAAQAFRSGTANQIEVRTQRAGDAVVATVRDNGPGIESEHLKRIFDAFFTTKASTTGTGIGLSISREIVRSYGGDIRVESTFGQSTTFTITLPHAIADGVPVEVRTLEPSQALPRATRILIVDDDAGIRRGYARAFDRIYDLTFAEHGQVAWELLEQNLRFDVIVCDLLMPVMSGIELYHRVGAERPQFIDAFIFVTGGAADPAVGDFFRACSSPVLEKPFEMHELRQLVEARRPSPTL